MEKFFIEALDHVHRQIRSSRASYVKAAGSEYHQKMAKAAAGKGPLPPVKTFGANPNSKNSVQQDLQQAEDWKYVTPTTDISELTWEQKGKTRSLKSLNFQHNFLEKVIRLLFAKLNGVAKERNFIKAKQRPLPSLKPEVIIQQKHSMMKYLKIIEIFRLNLARSIPLELVRRNRYFPKLKF